MIEFHITGRQKGKTNELLHWLSTRTGTEDALLLVHSAQERDRLRELVKRQKWNVNPEKIMVFDPTRLRGHKGVVGIDNVDLVLQRLLGCQIERASATGKVYSNLTSDGPQITKAERVLQNLDTQITNGDTWECVNCGTVPVSNESHYCPTAPAGDLRVHYPGCSRHHADCSEARANRIQRDLDQAIKHAEDWHKECVAEATARKKAEARLQQIAEACQAYVDPDTQPFAVFMRVYHLATSKGDEL